MSAIDRRLIQNFEWPVFGLGMLLVLIGILNLMSASPDANVGLHGSALRQLVWFGAGFIGLLVVLIPDYRSLERVAIPFYFVCLGMLVAVLFVGPIINGSQRWIILGPIRIQPSEIAKLAVIFLLARVLQRQETPQEIGLVALTPYLILIAIPAAIVLRQPDLGTAGLIVLAPATFIIVARVRMVSLVWLSAAGVGALGAAWFFYLHDYQKERVLTFLDPERDPLGTAYHAIQSQIAVGSGGFLGKGFGAGSQSQFGFLPEQQTDFVFSVLAEEWGFTGAAVVMMLYLALLIRGIMIARASKDRFGAYLALGIVAMLFWPIAINIGMVIGVFPVVGVPLPLLSYGGSSLVTCLVAIGLLMNISMRRYTF